MIPGTPPNQAVLSLAAPPVSLVSARSPSPPPNNIASGSSSRWNIGNEPPSNSRQHQLTATLRVSAASAPPSKPTTTPATTTPTRPPQPIEESQAYKQAQREAIALLSLSPSTSSVANGDTPSSSSQAHQEDGESDTDGETDNPFRAYSRLSDMSCRRKHIAQRRSSSGLIHTRASQSSRLPRRPSRYDLAPRGPVAPPPPLPSSRPPPPPEQTTTPAPPPSKASHLPLSPPDTPRPIRRAESLERAVADLGWYWRSDSEAIWGPTSYQTASTSEGQRSSSMSRLASTSQSSGPSRPESTLSRDEHDTGPMPSVPSGGFLSAYAAGKFDLNVVSSELLDIEQDNIGSHRPGLAAPIPDWETLRKRVICRLGVFSLRSSVLADIEEVRTGLAERLRTTKEEIRIDVLFGEEGWEFSPQGLEHHNNLRRDTFCAHVILNRNQGLTVNVRDDWRFRETPFLSEFSAISGFPITSATGVPVGGVCLASKGSRAAITEVDKASLRAAGEKISRLLEANFATIFLSKMSRLAVAYGELVSGPQSISCARLPLLDIGTGRVEPPRRGQWQLLETSASPSLDQCCQRMADAMKLDAVFFAALLPNVAGAVGAPASDRRLVIVAKSGYLCPVDETVPEALLDAFSHQDDDGCVILQNHFDHDDRPHKLPRPNDIDQSQVFTCAILVPLPVAVLARRRSSRASSIVEPNRQVDLILVAASRDQRHVLGIEDLRFLQYLRPTIHSTLARCVAIEPTFPIKSSFDMSPLASNEELLPAGTTTFTPTIQESLQATEMKRSISSAPSAVLRSSASSGSSSRGSNSESFWPPWRPRDFMLQAPVMVDMYGVPKEPAVSRRARSKSKSKVKSKGKSDSVSSATNGIGSSTTSRDGGGGAGAGDKVSPRSKAGSESSGNTPGSPPLSSPDRPLLSKRSLAQPLHLLARPMRLVRQGGLSSSKSSGSIPPSQQSMTNMSGAPKHHTQSQQQQQQQQGEAETDGPVYRMTSSATAEWRA